MTETVEPAKFVLSTFLSRVHCKMCCKVDHFVLQIRTMSTDCFLGKFFRPFSHFQTNCGTSTWLLISLTNFCRFLLIEIEICTYLAGNDTSKSCHCYRCQFWD